MWGFPALLPENVRAWLLWQDIQALGGEVALALNVIEVDDQQRGDLLLKLRHLAMEQPRIEAEKRRRDQK